MPLYCLHVSAVNRGRRGVRVTASPSRAIVVAARPNTSTPNRRGIAIQSPRACHSGHGSRVSRPWNRFDLGRAVSTAHSATRISSCTSSRVGMKYAVVRVDAAATAAACFRSAGIRLSCQTLFLNIGAAAGARGGAAAGSTSISSPSHPSNSIAAVVRGVGGGLFGRSGVGRIESIQL